MWKARRDGEAGEARKLVGSEARRSGDKMGRCVSGLAMGGRKESRGEPSYGARHLARPARRVSSRRVPPRGLVVAQLACSRPTLARFLNR